MNFKGLALAGSLAAILHVLWMIGALRWKAGVPAGQMGLPFAKFTLATVLSGGTGWLARGLLIPSLRSAGLHTKATDL